MRTLLILVIIAAACWAGVRGEETCKKNQMKRCELYCCLNETSTIEYCCPFCIQSVHPLEHAWCNSTTSSPPVDTSWWSKNGWWVELLLRIGIPVGFLLTGGVVILVLICTGKIKLRPRNLGPAGRVSAQAAAAAAAYQPPTYSQATGVGYPGQPTTYTLPQNSSATTAYPVQPPAYNILPGGAYPVQQPFAANPNYAPVVTSGQTDK